MIFSLSLRKCLEGERQFNYGALQLAMDNALKKAFKSLPYIVVRGKFLIPHPPKRPKYGIGSLKTDPLALIKRSYPHIIDQKILELAEMNERVYLIDMFMKQYQKQVERHGELLKEYAKEYVQPLKTVAKGHQPQMFYYRAKKQHILDIAAKEGESQNFKVLYRQFDMLADEEKEKYRQEANNYIKEKLKAYNQCCAKYMVPEKQFQHPHILYLRDTIDGPIKASMLGIYKNLEEQQKKKYRIMSRQLRQRDKQNLQAFLEKRNLSQQKFEYIKQICAKVQALKK